MNGAPAAPGPPWRGAPAAAGPLPPRRERNPVRGLLEQHLARGGRSRREAAAFALALTRPEAAEAIAAFFSRRREPPR